MVHVKTIRLRRVLEREKAPFVGKLRKVLRTPYYLTV